ncbi:glutathione-dependent disulfide-bond oxidoreductase [Aerococcaceae bacterium zg-ZUI334]|uniref:glutathione-dependent disulfide-bond oxidoreductase n=1 Tax=Aerococcaceae bacterium zg-252 TaxID=2796928 RepID=UPI001B981BD4|nr:glutathione-dependent disulfide-bond oxidoreductase [Aerococcaceae bacterium zg-ZUI334]
MTNYTKPDVWQWQNPNNEKSGNRPTAGARFEQTLPIGDAPHQVYSLGTPNGIKVAIIFEELKALGIQAAEYNLYQINIGKGDQFGTDFVNINPNSKIPTLVDYSTEQPLYVFESGSILLYLAEKFQQFIPTDIAGRTETLNWVFWQTGAGPYIGGGFGHFFHYAPYDMEYPIERFTMETKRQLDLLDQLLSEREYITGDTYTIADMMIWPWYGRLVKGHLYNGSDKFLAVEQYHNLNRWAEQISQRPAVQRALEVSYQPL